MSHTIALLVYPGFELLDASGPASVFAQANRALAEVGKSHFYKVVFLSAHGGLVTSSGDIAVDTLATSSLPPADVRTLLVVGAERNSLAAVVSDPALRQWVERCAGSSSRYGSVCSGAFILAAFGLLDGKRVTSHWDARGPLARMYPALTVDEDTLYVVDGNIWTSAGVTAGIDMALAMVTSDLGPTIAGRVAQRLLLYVRRQGYQSQFSPLLRVQLEADNPFADLINWIHSNLDQQLDVPMLARRVCLSERSFYRKFLATTGQTPARFVDALRLDAARMLLAQGLPIKVIASKVGLTPPSRFAGAFQRRFGITPNLFRGMQSTA